jgi:hypothetical protein
MRKTEKFHKGNYLTMKAVIVYDDFAFAAKANTALQRIGRRADVGVRWIIKPWQVNILKEAIPSESALADALDAHLILLAGQHSASLPAWIHDWLGIWAPSRKIRDAAVAVISHTTGFASPASSLLSRFVNQHGLNFISDEATFVKEAPRLSVHFSPEQKLPVPVLQPQLAGWIQPSRREMPVSTIDSFKMNPGDNTTVFSAPELNPRWSREVVNG